jgi:hypothetical protein
METGTRSLIPHGEFPYKRIGIVAVVAPWGIK